jgi:hypothetical protein
MSHTGHIQIPNDFDEADEWLGLGDDARLLFLDILTSCARRLTDGYLSLATLVRLRPSWTKKQRTTAIEHLVAASRIQAAAGGWQITNWTDFALTSQQVEEYRNEQARKAKLGGQARADGPRDERGHFLPTAAQVQPSPPANSPARRGGTLRPGTQPAGVEFPSPDSTPMTMTMSMTEKREIERTPLASSTASSARNDSFDGEEDGHRPAAARSGRAEPSEVLDAEEQKRMEELKRKFVEKNGALIEEWRREEAAKAKSESSA